MKHVSYKQVPILGKTVKDKYAISPPGVAGEESISGDTPNPESDDDVVKNAQEMGIGLKADEEHPAELDLARDVEKAEKYRQTH